MINSCICHICNKSLDISSTRCFKCGRPIHRDCDGSNCNLNRLRFGGKI